MPAIHTLKSVFNGGEISPILGSRVDSEKYAAGCKELTNFIPTVYGGIKKRPGTELLGFTKNYGSARLHGFKRSTETSFILEFGDQYIRFWKGGEAPGPVTINTNTVKDWVSGATIVKWTDRGYYLGEIISYNGLLYSSTYPSTTGGQPPPLGHVYSAYYWSPWTNPPAWNATTVYIPGTMITHQGRVYQARVSAYGYEPGSLFSSLFWTDIAGYEFVWGAKTIFSGEEARAFSIGDRLKCNGGSYECTAAHTAAESNKPGEGADWASFWKELSAYEIGDIVKTGGKYYACRSPHSASKTFAEDESRWMELTSVAGTAKRTYEIPSPYVAEEVFALQFTQLNDVLFIAHPHHPPARLTYHNETGWILDEVPFEYPPSLDVNADRTSVQVQYEEIPPYGQNWALNTEYTLGDRVHGTGTVAGYVYECILGHKAVAGNRPGIGTGSAWMTHWKLIWDVPAWKVGTYAIGDAVFSTPPQDGKVYVSKAVHTSVTATPLKPGTPAGSSYWELLEDGIVGYKAGDRVVAVDAGTVANKRNGEIFTCHTAYNPATVTSAEPGMSTAASIWPSQWNLGTSSTRVSFWGSSVLYNTGNRVRLGTTIYECTFGHKSVAPAVSAGSRPGVIVVAGNKPGVSRGWTRFWRIVASDTDVKDLTFSLCATDPVFKAHDVGTNWVVEIGTGGIADDMAIKTTASTDTTEYNPLFIQGAFTVSTYWNARDAMVGTITIEESLNGVTWSVFRQFTQTSKEEGNIFFNGEAPAIGAWYRMSLVSTGTSTAGSRVKMEALNSVYKLPFKITAFVSTTEVNGQLMMPGNRLPPAIAIGVSTSIFRRAAFSVTNGFPRTVAFHDSRLWWGGTKSHPTRMWASQTEDYYNYLGGSVETDGLDLTLATVESNAIQWMASFNQSLVVGTSGDEWTVDSGDIDEALTPVNIRARRRTRYGSSSLPPQLTGDALLWVRRGGGRLHEFAYVYERDSFSAPDLTLLAEHMLRVGEVKQTAFVSCPDPVLWLVDGNSLLGMTYNREHNVTAWHRHESTGGYFTSVASIYGRHAADEVWFVMERGSVRSVERFHPKTLAYYHGGKLDKGSVFDPKRDACFIDAMCQATSLGIFNSWTAKTVFPGFGLLREISPSGGDLVALLDGNGVSGSTHFELLSDGSISVNGATQGNVAGKKLILGWTAVKATMRSMNLEVMLPSGTAQGRHWRMIRAIPSVWRSRTFNLLVGESSGSDVVLSDDTTRILEEIHFSTGFTKELSWGVRSHSPFPCNLQGAVLKFEVSGE